MSRNTRRSRRRAASILRSNRKSWFRRYLKALSTGITAASIGTVSLLGQQAHAANDIWVGNTSTSWNVPANWSTAPTGPVTADTLEFGAAGTAGTTLVDNLMTPTTFSIAGITYDAGAPAYVVNPGTVGTNGFTLTGGITNNSTSLQTISDNIIVSANRTITTTPGGGDVTLSGTLSGAAGAAFGGLTITGGGTVNLTGPITGAVAGGNLIVSAGTLNVSNTIGTLNNPFPLTGTTVASLPIGNLVVGNTTGVPAVVHVSGGNLTPNLIVVGGALTATGNNPGSLGAIYQSGGTVNTTVGASTQVFQVGASTGGYGYYSLSGGTLISNEIGLAGANSASTGGAVAVMDITGGTFNENGWITMTRGASAGQIGILNITGGTVNTGNDASIGGMIAMGAGGATAAPTVAVINVTNATISGPARAYEMRLSDGGGAGSLGVVNLNQNGTMNISRVNAATVGPSTFFNFNGGTLRATITNVTNFMTSANLTGVNIFSGGATIDNNGLAINITNPLLAPAGSGVTSIALTDGGAGYIGAPAVTLSGGTGLGATAVATINPATGKVTGITVTGAGTGYTPGDVLTATLSGGGATTPATIGNITLAANVSGGVTFAGTGTTILNSAGTATTTSGLSTYTGPTVVKAGTLQMNGASSLTGTSGITLGTATTPATLLQNSSTALTPAVTLTNGTVNGVGTGAVSSLTVANSATNTVGNGNTGSIFTTQPLTVGNLTFSGSGTLAPVTALVSATTPAIAVTNLTVSGAAGSIKITPTNTTGGWSNGTYELVGYSGSIGGTGFPAFTLNITNLGARQTSQLTNTAGLINLVIGGNSAVWTGAANGNWTTTAVASPKNWALSSNQAPTDYQAGDAVVFDDTATGTTNVNITDTNVASALITFNNSAKNYSITGNPIVGTGGVILNGTGAVALGTANTFSGGILMNAGTLDINNASALGTGRLTLAQNITLDNTSGAPVTVSTGNLQTWNGDLTFTGTSDLNLGTGAVTLNTGTNLANAGRTTITTSTPGTTLTVGGPISALTGLTKTGPGILNLAGGATFPGQGTVAQGVLKISGGTAAFNSGTVPSLAAGLNANDNTSIIVNSGTLNTATELWLGSNTGAYGSLTVNGGTVNVGSWLALARSSAGTVAGVGLINVNGGTINVAANQLTIGSFGTQGGGGQGQVTVNAGGTITTTGTSGVFAGEYFPGTLNVLGNGTTQAQVNTVANTAGVGLELAVQAINPAGIVNLGPVGATGITNNGLITTTRVFNGAGNGTFNFHGGTLRSQTVALNAAFFTGVTNTYVWGEGAVLDSNGQTITVGQQLKPPTGGGIAAGAGGLITGLTVSGGGYVDTPYVQITGGDGTGATANAVIDANGNLTGIRLTNPGVNYTVAPTFTLVGGGPNGTGAIGGTAAIALNAISGELTKVGTGTLALTGNNTFTGGVSLNAGTLAINIPTALGTGALTIGAAGVVIDDTTGTPFPVGNAENWNNDFTFGGTRGLVLNGAISLGTSALATRTITTNAATAGTVLTVNGVISNGNNATTPTVNLAKAGTGTLLLNANNSFTGTLGVSAGTLQIAGTNALTGATSVTGGTLSLIGAGAINGSSSITVNAATAKLLQTSSVPISAPVTLTLGTIDGTTTINNVTVANAAGAILNHGNGTGSALTIGSLTFGGAATVNVLTSTANANSPRFVTTTLATNAAAKATIVPVNALGYWDPGTIQVMSYTGTIGGAGFAGFQLPATALAGLGGRQSATLDNSVAGQVNVVIGGNRALWTGAGNGNWDTATQTPQNWKLSAAGTATDFLANDSTQFDDTATGSTTINVVANVSPASAVFNNSTKNYTIQSSGAFGISGASAVVAKSGTGSLSINNANTYGGGTVLLGGTLNINNAAAIGTGKLTLNGGTLDNKSGGTLTLTTNNPGSWNGNFTFADSSDLNLGTGTVTLGADSTATIANGDLTVGPMTGTAAGLTKAGPGTLTINSSTTASNIGTGPLNVTAGVLQIGLPTATTATNFTAGGLTGSGTIENGSNTLLTASPSLVINNATDNVFSGVLRDGSAGGILGLTKGGAGTLTLSGNNTLSNGINVNGGQLLLTGTVSPASTGTIGLNTVSSTIAPMPILTLANGSTLNSPKNTAPSLQVGAGTGGDGVLRVNAGSTLNAASELWLATAEGGYGAMDMAGGTVNVGSWLALGRGGGQGILNQSGGSITVQTNNLTVGSFGGAAGNGVVHGQVNLTGGTLSTVNNTYAGEQTNGVVNVSGSGHLIVGTSGVAGLALIPAVTNATTVGIVNLLPGGLITTPQVHQGQGQGIVNFQGGVLQASTDSAAFMTPTGFTGTLTAYAYQGNAVIDTNGHTLFMDEPISPPTGKGVSATGLTVTGSGYSSAPVVQIIGGGGLGASANATIDANGNLTGIVMTSPGVNYSSAPTFTLSGGTLGAPGKINGTAALTPNVSGGLTKVGSGSLTLLGLSTYTGPTTIKQGVLTPGVAGAIPIASTIAMAGGNLATGGVAAQFGPLQVTDNSGIDLGFGGGIVDFASSTTIPWTPNKAVSILNWTGSPNTAGGTDQLTFDSAGLTAAQIAAVHFQGYNGAKFIGNELVPISTTTRKLGDINVDGHVNAADVTAMLGMLTDLNAYKTSKSLSTDDILNIGDIDSSGSVTNADLQALITYIQSGNGSLAPVPEPGTLVLLVCGAIPGAAWLVRSRRKSKGDVA